jgi:hypothetical protein
MSDPSTRLRPARATRKWMAKMQPGTPASQWPSLAEAAMQAGIGRDSDASEVGCVDVSIDVDVEPPQITEPTVIVEPQPPAAPPPRPARAGPARGPFGTLRMKRVAGPTVKLPRRVDARTVRLRIAIGAGVLTLGFVVMWLLLNSSHAAF